MVAEGTPHLGRWYLWMIRRPRPIFLLHYMRRESNRGTHISIRADLHPLVVQRSARFALSPVAGVYCRNQKDRSNREKKSFGHCQTPDNWGKTTYIHKAFVPLKCVPLRVVVGEGEIQSMERLIINTERFQNKKICRESTCNHSARSTLVCSFGSAVS